MIAGSHVTAFSVGSSFTCILTSIAQKQWSLTIVATFVFISGIIVLFFNLRDEHTEWRSDMRMGMEQVLKEYNKKLEKDFKNLPTFIIDEEALNKHN